MTHIFTGLGLGIHGSSLPKLASYGPKGNAGLGQGGASVYVNAANGNLLLQQSDGFMSDFDVGMRVFQSYNSQGNGGWSLNVATLLEFEGRANTSGSIVKRTDEDGHVSRFVYDAQRKAYVPEDGSTSSLIFDGSLWSYRDAGESSFSQYNSNGRLTAYTDCDGHVVRLNYQFGWLTSMTDMRNQQKVTWSYNWWGQVVDVSFQSTDNIVHHLHQDYDDKGRLSRVSRDMGEGKTYWVAYDYVGDSKRIGGIRQSDGTSLHLDYDAEGRIKRLVDGAGHVTVYEYAAGQTRITDGNGKTWTYFYDEHARLTGMDSPENIRTRYHYDGQRLDAITQGTQRWSFAYNDAGDCVRTESPTGDVVLRQYDAEHHLLSETHYQAFAKDSLLVSQPVTSQYCYDQQGHCRFEVKPDGTVLEHRYNRDGCRVSTRTYLRANVDLEPIALEALVDWSRAQNQSDIRLIDYHYDWRGNVLEEIHYSRVDSKGEGIRTNDAICLYTRYDAKGQLIEKSATSEQGLATTHYIYDALGRLIKTIDAQNHTQTIEYDDCHQRVLTTDANGLQTLRIYDHSGLLLSTQRLDAGHDYGTTYYCYDGEGRLTAETNVEGKTQYLFYDADGRMQATVSSSGQVTEYCYDEEGRCTLSRQYAQAIPIKDERVTFAEIKPRSPEFVRTQQWVYNDHNQLAYHIDASGAVIAYEYDPQGRVIAKRAYATRLPHYQSLQPITFANVAPVAHANDRNQTYYYDLNGRLQAEINGEGAATAYYYDRQGNVIETVRFALQCAQKRTNDWQTMIPASDDRDIHTYSIYNSAGLKVAEIDAEGYMIEYRYDARGLLIEKRAYVNGINVIPPNNQSLDALRPVPHSNDHITSYRYNDLNQCIEETLQNGLRITYFYDESGWLTRKVCVDSRSQEVRGQCYRHDALGRVISHLNEAGEALLQRQLNASPEEIEAIWAQHSEQFTYDIAGRLKSKTNALNQTSRYLYNDEGLLMYTISADGAVTETRYNSFQQVEASIRYSARLPADTDATIAHLKGLADQRFDEITEYEYNSIGLLSSKRELHGARIDLLYNAFGELSLSTQLLNANTRYEYNHLGLLLRRTEDATKLHRVFELQYDTFGRVDQEWDGQLAKSRSLYNRRGERIALINPNSVMSTMEYDAFGRVVRADDKTDARMIYNDVERTLIITHEGSSSTVTTQFNAFGDRITVVDGNRHATHYHYNVQGQLIDIEAPENTTSHYEYDAAGHVIAQISSGGLVVQYTYDAEDHVLTKVVDPEGLHLETRYRYDGVGRQLEVMSAAEHIQLSYDHQGNLVKTCLDPEGLNLVTEYDYDERGLLVREIKRNPQGVDKVTAHEWDAWGRCVSTTMDPDGLNLTTRYEYDHNNLLIRETNPNQHVTQFIYDANHQLRFRIDPRGVVTEHRYDEHERETQKITYATRVDPQKYDDLQTFMSEIKVDEAADHHQFFAYDALGRLTQSYDGLGDPTTYTYDDNNNLTSVRRCSRAFDIQRLKTGFRPDSIESNESRRTEFVYDALNRQSYKREENGSLTEFLYDASGHLIQQIRHAQDPHDNQSIRYAYDAVGRMTYQASAEGIVTAYRYDNAGHQTERYQYAMTLTDAQLNQPRWMDAMVSQDSDRVQRTIHDAAGREVYRISASGRVVERRYDAVGNVIQEIKHGRSVILTSYTLDSVASALNSDTVHATDFDYDAAGRLLSTVDPEQRATRYTYDRNNNVSSKLDANHAEWVYVYDESNQLIETRAPMTRVQRYKDGRWIEENRSIVTQNQYDSFGNLMTLIRDVGGIHQTVHYTYDLNNRKLLTIYPHVSVSSATQSKSELRQETLQTLSESVRYNAFGEEIARRDRAGFTRYSVYDQKGQMVYALNANGSLTEYQYSDTGQVSRKVQHANPISLETLTDFSADAIKAACRPSDRLDRYEAYRYDRDQRLIETRKNEITFYNAQSKSYQQAEPTTRQTYNAFGDITQTAVQITDTTWATTQTRYDKDGLKTATLDPEGYLTRFTYDAYGFLAEETQYAERANGWDATAQAKDRTIRCRYNALGQLTRKTQLHVTYQRVINNGKSLENIMRDLTSDYGYDAMGHLVSTTDPEGNTAYCYYNELGQLTAKAGAVVRAGRAATSFTYDALGQLIETRQWVNGVRFADESKILFNDESSSDILTHDDYDTQGHLVSQTDGTGHTVFYSYDANNNIARSWQVVKQIDGKKVIKDKRYVYDAENHLVQTQTYNARGGVTTEDAKYNAFGDVIQKGINGYYSSRVDYDNAGRGWRSNTQGYFQILQYDLVGNVTRIVTSSNIDDGVDLSNSLLEPGTDFNEGSWYYDVQRQDNQIDALGRVIAQEKAMPISVADKLNQTTIPLVSQRDVLDRWGNVISHTNVAGLTTTYDYNALDGLIRQTMPEMDAYDDSNVVRRVAPVIDYAYDALGRSIGMIDANGHIASKMVDAEGHILQETDAMGNSRQKEYNLLHQQVRTIDERGYRIIYTYDKANRLVSVRNEATNYYSQYYEYNGAGQLIRQTDGVGNKTSFRYDEMGHQIQRQQANARDITSYDYDDAGHKIYERDANGNTQTWRYNAMGRLEEHTDMGGHTTSYRYNQNGLLRAEQSTAGKNIAYQYFSDGELKRYDDIARTESVELTYDQLGHVLSRRTSKNNWWALETDYYQYDNHGRLLQVQRQGAIQGAAPLFRIDYTYDVAGMIRSTAVETHYPNVYSFSHQDYYRYDANNRMVINKGQLVNGLIDITASQGSAITYDAKGNISTAVKVEGGQRQQYAYYYNADNQLYLTQKNGVSLQAKAYDAAGNVNEEALFDNRGVVTQHNYLSYEFGKLKEFIVKNIWYTVTSKNVYSYDDVGNLMNVITYAPDAWSQMYQQYSNYYEYERWDNYLLKIERAGTRFNPVETKSGRVYNVNGQLAYVMERTPYSTNSDSWTDYFSSGLDGLVARKDKGGQTSYVKVAGKTIGDLRVDNNNQTHLEIYGGFTPEGGFQTTAPGKGFITTRKVRHGLHHKKIYEYHNSSEVVEVGAIQPNAPQDNLGAYIVQAGDTLENIARQVYGDGSLWYLIADANGITDRHAHAGEIGGQLHVGARLNIPQAATGQHHNSETHKLITGTELAHSPTLSAPTPAPIQQRSHHHHSFWKTMAKIAVAVISAVVMVMSAGALAAIVAPQLALGGLMGTGLSALGGASSLSLAQTAGIGFAAGFISSIAGQGAANALNLQKGMNFKGALLTGLATAATAGMTKVLSGSSFYKSIHHAMSDSPMNRVFGVSSATEMMERDALGQGLNMAMNHHQRFDWLELGVSAATAGIMGSDRALELNQAMVNKIGPTSAFINSEIQALATGTINSHFDAQQILTDNLGNALTASLFQKHTEPGPSPEKTSKSPAWNHSEDDVLDYGRRLFGGGESDYVVLKAEDDGRSTRSITHKGRREVSNFDALQSRIFSHEGGFSNHPNDLGGATNKGITFETFKKYSKADLGISPTLSSLKKLTNEQAAVIYKKRYWDPLRADEIKSASVAYSLYDFHVNAPSQAVRLMQKSVNMLGGNLTVDNKMGPLTIKAINQLDAHKLFNLYHQNKINYYINRANTMPSQKVFLLGWLKRANDIHFGG